MQIYWKGDLVSQEMGDFSPTHQFFYIKTMYNLALCHNHSSVYYQSWLFF